MRSILRVVMTVVASVLALYVVYLLRTPISWMLIAIFVAVATSGPVNLLSRRVPRGAAIAIVYIGIVLAPVAIGAVLIPPAVEQGVKLAKNLPDYVDDLNQTFQDNDRLNELNDKYDLTTKLDDAANDLVSNLGSAAHRPRGHRIDARLLDLRAGDDPRDEHVHGVARAGPGATRRCRTDHPTRPSASGAPPTASRRRWRATWAGRWRRRRSPARRRS